MLFVCCLRPREVFGALQPGLDSASWSLGVDPLYIGAAGAAADFAERLVPIVFCATLLLFVYLVSTAEITVLCFGVGARIDDH